MWYRLARSEWSQLVGKKLRYRRHKFTWERAAGAKRGTGNGTTSLAVAWREAARRAEDNARLAKNTRGTLDMQQREAYDAHAAAINSLAGRLPPSVPPTHKEQLTRWAKQCNAAQVAKSSAWIKRLVDVADNKKQKKLESEAKHKRMSEWREAIGATNNNSRRTSPTRLAYRWLKGITGWTKSPLGPESANEAVPDEPDDEADQLADSASTHGSHKRHPRLAAVSRLCLCDAAVRSGGSRHRG